MNRPLDITANFNRNSRTNGEFIILRIKIMMRDHELHCIHYNIIIVAMLIEQANQLVLISQMFAMGYSIVGNVFIKNLAQHKAEFTCT